MKLLLSVLALALMLSMIGCGEQGPAEKAGSRVDEVIDNVEEGQPPFHEKGTFERAGEAIDESVDRATEDD